MQKTKFFTCLYHTVLFFCSKRCKIKFNTLFDYENKQLNRITINHSEDIYLKILSKFTEDVQKNLLIF